MKCKLTIICGPDLVNGFQLAGAHAVVVETAEQAQQVLIDKLQNSRWEVTLLAEDILDWIPARLRKRLTGSLMPLFVPLPMRTAEELPDVHGYVNRMIQKAIGKRIALG